ncbi:MAG TPA: hypothetical protein PKJ08_12685, partial [Candidatus Cloacimonadota bacterium]|nr:hypothetical protein [Candidatus Cloacimonadota bacterium]
MKLIYKNLLLIALCFIFLTNLSCNGVVKDFETKNIQNPRQGKSEKAGSEKEFSEIYINGTDAGTYFQTLYKLNKYDEMIQITCTESLRKFGTAAVLEYYKNQMSFAYELGKLT